MDGMHARTRATRERGQTRARGNWDPSDILPLSTDILESFTRMISWQQHQPSSYLAASIIELVHPCSVHIAMAWPHACELDRSPPS
jgi:hypothetical protein